MREQDVQSETVSSEVRSPEETEVSGPDHAGIDSTWQPRSWFTEIGRWRADLVK
ncbi:hypothetical protein SAMN04487820_112100 [Actinopolyspora mzabensis]|uniref:Uncharacterized protein n=1 Tax=Actinopolyspora mzabensis TaxID=995066 RepID=A0A1G9EJV4_ACTMZ|nr:hypothetical protein [Actinopolyspora mzabensis]SDK76467.1 hypothetical protein SAMN04487820_112100 [Actinopolyspora mzabensis]